MIQVTYTVLERQITRLTVESSAFALVAAGEERGHDFSFAVELFTFDIASVRSWTVVKSVEAGGGRSPPLRAFLDFASFTSAFSLARRSV